MHERDGHWLVYLRVGVCGALQDDGVILARAAPCAGHLDRHPHSGQLNQPPSVTMEETVVT